MDEFDIPVFKRAYDLYREFYLCRQQFPKADRYSLGQTCERAIIELLGCLLRASGASRTEKAPHIDRASMMLNLIRVHLRLAKDIRALDTKRYLALALLADEIGRMIGGWKRSLKERQ